MMKSLHNVVIATLILIGTALAVQAEDTHAFPNPFVAKKSTLGTIAFTPLPTSGSITIYSIDGVEVRSLPIDNNIVSWDTKNAGGKNVASGVYYFRVNGGPKETVGKLVIIR